MKCLSKPKVTAETVFDSCVLGVKTPAFIKRLADARDDVLDLAQDYADTAVDHELYNFLECQHGKRDQIIVAPLTKGDLMDLYTTYMVKETDGRAHYDALIMSAKLCPYCQISHSSTLDHYLSKARHPAFSVLPLNLVPACKDCNDPSLRPEPGVQIEVGGLHLHPYYEDGKIEKDAWLFADIVQSTPASASFYVAPPQHWDKSLSHRARNHFREFRLAKRYAIQSANELASTSDFLKTMPSFAARQSHLTNIAGIERQKRTNTWKAALLEALANSNWYLQTGYLL